MATLGNLEEFDTSNPASWTAYKERIKFYLEANNITTEERKRAVFLSICGNATFQLTRTLVAPNELADTAFTRMIQLLDEHFNPKPSEIVQRFLFHKREQKTGEGISTYIAELRKLAEHCNFGTQLETMLRDRIVCGLRDENVQRRLLSETNLTFKSAFEMVLAAETTSNHVVELRKYTEPTSPQEEEVHRTNNTDGFQQQNKAKKAARNVQAGGEGISRNEPAENRKCFRCDRAHHPNTCRFQTATCRYCSKVGHIERACITKKRNRSSTQEDVKTIFNITQGTEPIIHKVQLNEKDCKMEIDSGAGQSLISQRTFETLWPRSSSRPTLKPCKTLFRDYQQNTIATMGTCMVHVRFQNREALLPLVVTEGNAASLLGRNWFEDLGIQVKINTIEESEDSITGYADIFEEKLGTYRGSPVHLDLDPSIRPIALRARPLAYALRPLVEAELDKLIQEGVLVPTKQTKWATPIVPVVKADKQSVRLCADYKCTVNKALTKSTYPMPNINDMMATLNGAKYFTKLDMAKAYLQLTVDEETAEVQAIITHKGIFKVKRLQFGITTAPQIFQQFVDNLLSGIPGVLPYYDDILISAPSQEEETTRVRQVLKRFADNGLKLNLKKCLFDKRQIDFLGLTVSDQGIQPNKEKVTDIHMWKKPENKRELQSFLGLVNFYHNFLQDKATVAEPLHRLLENKRNWEWGPVHQEAFDRTKQLITSESLLAHYEPKKELILSCDASPWGVGMVLSHRESDGSTRPIAYHSKTLSAAERKYSQLDKEALAVITGVKKFHNYVYGRQFTIETDHKPLLGLIGENKAFPEMTSPRLVRWAIALSGYQYQLTYKPGAELGHADALSRKAGKSFQEKEEIIEDVLMIENLPEIPLKTRTVATLTDNDTILKKVKEYVQQGWPNTITEEYKPFRNRQNELSIYKDCLLWGSRVIMPKQARDQALHVLHAAHVGMVRMKALARSYMWWPGMDKAIEDTVRNCRSCQHHAQSPTKVPLHPWELPSASWTRVHIDFAGPFHGHTFLILVDAYSKWIDAKTVKTTSTKETLRVLREIFATHGLPEVIVSDNGTCFTSEDFKQFTSQNGIRHCLTPPYHPATNGQAERMVREVKDKLKKLGGNDWETKLARFLFSSHTTPTTTTGTSPAELLFKRRLRTAFDLIMPNDTQQRTQQRQEVTRQLELGENVWAKAQLPGKKWEEETVTALLGPVTYRTTNATGQVKKRHIDQLRKRNIGSTFTQRPNPNSWLPYPRNPLPGPLTLHNDIVPAKPGNMTSPEHRPTTPNETSQDTPAVIEASPEETRRSSSPSLTTPGPSHQNVESRPKRDRRAPAHLQHFEVDF